MRNKTGIFCMFLGAALIFGALLLFARNQREARNALEESADLIPRLISQIEQSRTQVAPSADVPLSGDFPQFAGQEMPEVVIDGNGYIGYLWIPALGLELPVMGDWDYTKLRTAPCRYTGTVQEDDLVVMAHNYSAHFGRLAELSQGDSISFTDMNGRVIRYAVVGKDILDPYAVEEMTSGDFDLTLFTCTYGGQSRVTVYCDRQD